ncbi:hypothetical protein [Saccharothrix sp. HUAS TT1]|uniref:hypothetical protein n=1 Tax=unclassified Saccharothrix TaxID=2593673 RepID=UPI00345BF82D
MADYSNIGNPDASPTIGTVAEQDDIAPQGTVITAAHVKAYRRRVNAAAKAAGTPPPTWD